MEENTVTVVPQVLDAGDEDEEPSEKVTVKARGSQTRKRRVDSNKGATVKARGRQARKESVDSNKDETVKAKGKKKRKRQANSNEDDRESIVEEQPIENKTDYSAVVKAIKEDDLETLENFIDDHPEALTARVFPKGRTALHHALAVLRAKENNMALWLVDRMKAADLEIQDGAGFTALARGAEMDYRGLLLKRMVGKNPNLPNIGHNLCNFPVIAALGKGYKNTARYLYKVTSEDILNSDVGGRLLTLCIPKKTFDIALDLVQKFPYTLFRYTFYWGVLPEAFSEISRKSEHQQSRKYNLGYKPISGKSNDDEKQITDKAAFFKLVFKKVSTYTDPESVGKVHQGIKKAIEHGNIAFIHQMITANPELLSYDNTNDRNNILHLAAMLPSSVVRDRISSNPALQMHREILWFKAVENLVTPDHIEHRNKEGLTPRELFSRQHEKLIAAGDRLMKETATSSTVVGALILTIMFAAAFTVPGGNHQDTGYPMFTNKILFKFFIICDVLLLSSSATSILVFLSILANSHGDEDFLFHLPTRLMMGVLTLFFSIATMMVTFCLALALMLDGDLQFILPIALISSVPVIVYSKSMFHLLSEFFISTFKSIIFDKTTKLPTDSNTNEWAVTIGNES